MQNQLKDINVNVRMTEDENHNIQIIQNYYYVNHKIDLSKSDALRLAISHLCGNLKPVQ